MAVVLQKWQPRWWCYFKFDSFDGSGTAKVTAKIVMLLQIWQLWWQWYCKSDSQNGDVTSNLTVLMAVVLQKWQPRWWCYCTSNLTALMARTIQKTILTAGQEIWRQITLYNLNGTVSPNFNDAFCWSFLKRIKNR
jgi:hypothetical protein